MKTNKETLNLLAKDFILCGLMGWCIEVAFTSACSAISKDKKLTGHSSAWMFPIYGMAAGIGIIAPKITKWPIAARGALYGSSIMLAEFLSGSLLKKFDVCPWDYSDAKYNVKGVIRWDFLPFWILAGLLYERVLMEK